MVVNKSSQLISKNAVNWILTKAAKWLLTNWVKLFTANDVHWLFNKEKQSTCLYKCIQLIFLTTVDQSIKKCIVLVNCGDIRTREYQSENLTCWLMKYNLLTLTSCLHFRVLLCKFYNYDCLLWDDALFTWIKKIERVLRLHQPLREELLKERPVWKKEKNGFKN